MTPLQFLQANTLLGNDPECRPLPAFQDTVETISLYGLSWRERFLLLYSGKLWLRQYNHGMKPQPHVLTTDTPFASQMAP